MNLPILAVSLCACVSVSLSTGTATPEKRKTVVYPKEPTVTAIKDLIEGLGFQYESHSVTTADGYILNLNRMVTPKMVKRRDRGVPILLVNGLFMHSEAWMVNGFVDGNIAATLARRGYDVWLGDHRGTLRSQRHVNVTVNQQVYWDFSFHESGVYDLPAFIDYILESTGHERLIYSCMSVGCSFHLALLTHKPEYNDKLIGAVDFVPLGKLWKRSNLPTPTHLGLQIVDMLVKAFENNNISNVKHMDILKRVIKAVCSFNPKLTVNIIELLTGRFKYIDRSRVCDQFYFAVSDSSVKSVAHMLQIFDTGDFAEFDYGREENKRLYGTELPPLYDLKKVTSFVALYSGGADIVTPSSAIEAFRKQLGGPTYKCEMDDFHHLDYGVGTSIGKVVPDVIQLVDSLSGYANDTTKMRSGRCPRYIAKYG